MKLAIICPLGRNRAKSIAANLQQQTFREFGLVVVENGRGRGSCEAAQLRPNMLVSADCKTPGAAKNLGLKVAKALGFTHWATFDDDDWYGPEYLAELVAAFNAGHEVVGKAAHFTKLASGEVVFFSCGDGEIRANREAGSIQGPTIASSFWDGMPLFDESAEWGEDNLWCNAVKSLGKPAWATSPFNWCYLRHGVQHGHTYPARDRHLLALSRGDIFDVGAWGDSVRRLISSSDTAQLATVAKLREKPELKDDDMPRRGSWQTEAVDA